MPTSSKVPLLILQVVQHGIFSQDSIFQICLNEEVALVADVDTQLKPWPDLDVSIQFVHFQGVVEVATYLLKLVQGDELVQEYLVEHSTFSWRYLLGKFNVHSVSSILQSRLKSRQALIFPGG